MSELEILIFEDRLKQQMRKSLQTVSQKQQNFRIDIRRRQIDQFFRLCRHQLQQLCGEQSMKICNRNFTELEAILDYEQTYEKQSISNSNYNKNAYITPLKNENYPQYLPSCDSNENSHKLSNNINIKLQILLKQLRDINCFHRATQVFIDGKNLSILFRLYNYSPISRRCQQFLLEIVLNISSYTDEECKRDENLTEKISKKKQTFQWQIIKLQLLNMQRIFRTNSRNCILLMFQILSNLLLRDRTSCTLYNLIKKEKIYKYILQFLVDQQRRSIYEIIDIKQTFMWFVNRILLLTVRYRYMKIESDFGNVVEAFYSQVLNDVNLAFQKADGSKCGINNLFLYLKTVIKCQIIELQQQLIQKLNNLYFSPTDLHYLQYLGTLTYHTLFRLQTKHLEQLLQFLLINPTSIQSPSILRCISNSLTNDSTDWRIVLQNFIKYSQMAISDPHEDNLLHLDNQINGSSSFIHHFSYFLNQSNTEPDMAQIIKIIVSAQGGLGIFQQSIQVIGKSEYMRQILSDLGFDD